MVKKKNVWCKIFMIWCKTLDAWCKGFRVWCKVLTVWWKTYIRLRLQIPCTHDLSIFAGPTSNIHSRFFPTIGRSRKNLSIPGFTQENHRLLIPLINIRNNKMKSWTHPASPIFEWNQEHNGCNFSWLWIKPSASHHQHPPNDKRPHSRLQK